MQHNAGEEQASRRGVEKKAKKMRVRIKGETILDKQLL